jgi:hypothetical protein
MINYDRLISIDCCMYNTSFLLPHIHTTLDKSLVLPHSAILCFVPIELSYKLTFLIHKTFPQVCLLFQDNFNPKNIAIVFHYDGIAIKFSFEGRIFFLIKFHFFFKIPQKCVCLTSWLFVRYYLRITSAQEHNFSHSFSIFFFSIQQMMFFNIFKIIIVSNFQHSSSFLSVAADKYVGVKRWISMMMKSVVKCSSFWCEYNFFSLTRATS